MMHTEDEDIKHHHNHEENTMDDELMVNEKDKMMDDKVMKENDEHQGDKNHDDMMKDVDNNAKVDTKEEAKKKTLNQ